MGRRQKFCLALCAAAALVLLDQFTKWLCLARLRGGGGVTLIPGALQLVYVENRGAAFGIFQNRQWLFVIIAVLAIAALLYYLTRAVLYAQRISGLLCVSLVLLLAGAVGNLIDRVRLGYVVDFIYFALIDFPVFNAADICVTVGCGLLFIYAVFSGREKGEAE